MHKNIAQRWLLGLTLFGLVACGGSGGCHNGGPLSDGGGVLDGDQERDLSEVTNCRRCLLDMRCTEGCNALGVCPAPSTECR